MVNDQVDEFMLVSGQLAAFEERIKCTLRGGPIQADQGAHEDAKASFLAYPFHLLRRVQAGLSKDALQLGQVSLRQRLVPIQLENRYVALIGFEELPRLGVKPVSEANLFV